MKDHINNLLQLAVNSIHENRLCEAALHLNKALQAEPKQFEAIRLLGIIAALEKRWVEALDYFERAILIDPENGIIHSNKGNVLIELKRYQDALLYYERAINLEPSYAEAYNNKGNALQGLIRYEEALKCYEDAIRLDPDYSEAYSNKGNALSALKDYKTALQLYENAIAKNSLNAQAYCGAALIFNQRKQYALAIACSKRTVEIAPQYIEAWLCLGLTYLQVKDYELALTAFDAVIKFDAFNTSAWLAKADLEAERKNYKLAQHYFKSVSEFDYSVDFVFGSYMQSTLHMCEWKNEESMEKILIESIKNGERKALPYNVISRLDNPCLINQAMKVYAEAKLGNIKREHFSSRPQNKKIRLAYFSADFHNHPTAYLIAELFEKHDKSQFEIIGFVFGRNQPDEMRERLIRSFDEFIDVDNKTDEEIAALSREMNIDIAIDLKGFTTEGRPKIFMFGCAPIQISYLAFPGTMGLSCFDYIIADPILIPKDQQNCYVEKVIYMPNSYQVNDRNRKISENKKTRQYLGLPETGFVFCCFNNNYKITPAVFKGWINILNAVDGSILWLFGDNPEAIENLKIEFSKASLHADRLIFAGRADHADHLARYQLADLFLDTFPCNAHTTASDALWAGLPLITLIGNSFASRVAASLLSAVGLSDLICHTQEEYERMAIHFAQNSLALSNVKERLATNRFTSPLFDTTLFARDLESAYITAYENSKNGLAPAHIYVDRN
jgi:predicted O-linked N-acetylglucosamine transferase (SPINDLY family)